jgi:hypothetical protein
MIDLLKSPGKALNEIQGPYHYEKVVEYVINKLGLTQGI